MFKFAMPSYRPARDLFLTVAAAILAFAYASTYFWGELNLPTANLEAHGRFEKPFVFRALMPFLAQSLVTFTGWRVDSVVTLLVILSGIAFVFTLRFFLQTFYRTERADIIALALLAVFTMLFEWQRHIYDFPTAIFFSLGLALISRGRMVEYLVIFAVASINRETTIFLSLIFFAYLRNQLHSRKLSTYLAVQIAIYLIIQGFIRMRFQDVPGGSFIFDPMSNIQKHLTSWVTIVHFAILSIILWLVGKGWAGKPRLLRITFALLFPTLFLMYVLVGYAFEYRVFAEIYSTTALLALSSIPQKVTGILPQSPNMNTKPWDDQ